MRKQALLALELAKKCRLIQVEKGLKTTHDDVIVQVAIKWGCPVATNDRELRKRLRDHGIPVIYLRQKHRLEIEGAV